MKPVTKILTAAALITAAVILIKKQMENADEKTPEYTYTPVSIATAAGAMNNPGNIRKGNNWKNEIEPEITGPFESFKDLADGYRALIKLLRNYYGQGFTTISKIINKYAPAGDNNNPVAYADFLANYTGIGKNADLKDIIFTREINPILKGITKVEQGTKVKINEKSIEEAHRRL